MLIEMLGDQWICSCGNWVDQAFTWCPDCCEDREHRPIYLLGEQEAPSKANYSLKKYQLSSGH
ncbi:hypothetical protein ACFL7M_09435 [Thermodesulfobacteriota bacterium]